MQSFESVCKDGMAVPGLFFTDPVRRRRERVRGIESCVVIAVGRNYQYIYKRPANQKGEVMATLVAGIYIEVRDYLPFPLGTKRNGRGYIEQEARGRGRESIKAEGNPRERETDGQSNEHTKK